MSHITLPPATHRNAAAYMVAAGIEIVGEVGSWEGHEWLYFRSPDGHLFEVKKTPGSGPDDR